MTRNGLECECKINRNKQPKNFKNIHGIAEAKAEIMNNIKKGGRIILNRDDSFYAYHKNFAFKKKLNVCYLVGRCKKKID